MLSYSLTTLQAFSVRATPNAVKQHRKILEYSDLFEFDGPRKKSLRPL
jgi:hypothetical protein